MTEAASMIDYAKYIYSTVTHWIANSGKYSRLEE